MTRKANSPAPEHPADGLLLHLRGQAERLGELAGDLETALDRMTTIPVVDGAEAVVEWSGWN